MLKCCRRVATSLSPGTPVRTAEVVHVRPVWVRLIPTRWWTFDGGTVKCTIMKGEEKGKQNKKKNIQ